MAGASELIYGDPGPRCRRRYQYPRLRPSRGARLGARAYGVLVSLAEGDRLWATPWPCCFEFLSVVTNRRIRKDSASTPTQAWQQFRAWTASPSNRMIGETDDFVSILRRFVVAPADCRWCTFTMLG